MNTIAENNNPNVNLNNEFDALCQQFYGGSFFGLEYILEEFFHDTTKKTSANLGADTDWFGLYNL